jgi:hypothetical protein
MAGKDEGKCTYLAQWKRKDSTQSILMFDIVYNKKKDYFFIKNKHLTTTWG